MATAGASAPIIRAALLQLPVSRDKADNVARASAAVRDAADRTKDLLVLPEIWNSEYAATAFPKYTEPISNVGESLLADETLNSETTSLAPIAKLANERE